MSIVSFFRTTVRNGRNAAVSPSVLIARRNIALTLTVSRRGSYIMDDARIGRRIKKDVAHTLVSPFTPRRGTSGELARLTIPSSCRQSPRRSAPDVQTSADTLC